MNGSGDPVGAFSSLWSNPRGPPERIATSENHGMQRDLRSTGRILSIGESPPRRSCALFDKAVSVTVRLRRATVRRETRANKAIYERRFVKARRLRISWGRGFGADRSPSASVSGPSGTRPRSNSCTPRSTSSEPEAEGRRSPPSSNASSPRCLGRRDVFAQPSIRDRRTRRRRHSTGIQGTPPFNRTTVGWGRRQGSLRGRPLVVTPARRRSTVGSLSYMLKR